MRKYYKTFKDNSAGKQHRKDLCRIPCSDCWGTVQSYKTWGSHHLKECKIVCVIPFFLPLLCPVNDILINIWQNLIAFLTGMHNKHLHRCIMLSICWMCKPITSARGWFLASPFLQSVKVTLNGNTALWHVWCTFCPIIQIINVDVKQHWTQYSLLGYTAIHQPPTRCTNWP